MGFVRAMFGSWLTEVTVLGRKTAEKALLAPAGQGRGCHMTHPPTTRGVDLRPLPRWLWWPGFSTVQLLSLTSHTAPQGGHPQAQPTPEERGQLPPLGASCLGLLSCVSQDDQPASMSPLCPNQ